MVISAVGGCGRQSGVILLFPEGREEALGCIAWAVFRTYHARSMPMPTDNAPLVYLETFGCQMNVLDSELVTGHLLALGYRFTNDRDVADVVLFNTCSVREQAENKVFSRVGRLKQEKQAGRQVTIGLLGCLAEREGASLLTRQPEIDLLCGPGELDRLPMLLDNAMKEERIPGSRPRLRSGFPRVRFSLRIRAYHPRLQQVLYLLRGASHAGCRGPPDARCRRE